MKKAITSLVFFISLILTTSSFAEEDFSAYMREAGKEFKANEPKKALTTLLKAEPLATTDTEKLRLGNALGWTFFATENNDKAREYLQKTLELAIKTKESKIAKKVSNNLGVLEYTSGDLDKAEHYFNNQWAKNSPTSDKYLNMIQQQKQVSQINQIIESGVKKFLDGKFTEAIIEYDKALAITPNNSRALEYKGYAYYRLGDYDKAITILKIAEETKSERFNIIINLMKAYCSAKKTDELEQLITKYKQSLANKKEVLEADAELNKACADTDKPWLKKPIESNTPKTSETSVLPDSNTSSTDLESSKQ